MLWPEDAAFPPPKKKKNRALGTHGYNCICRVVDE